MKILWRRTIGLLRNQPVLWLPVAVAAVLSYFWQFLGKALLHELMMLPSRGSSVLGASHESAPSAPLWLAAFVKAGFQFIDIFCYVIALLVIARMVDGFLAPEGPTANAGNGFVIRQGWAAIRISFLSLLLAFSCTAISISLVSRVAMSYHRPALMLSPYLIFMEILPMYAALAYLITPAALRLLKEVTDAPIGNAEVTLGRKLAFCCGLALSVISVVLVSAQRSFQGSSTQRAPFAFASTLLSGLPYAALFVGLSILTSGQAETDMPSRLC